MMLEAKKVVADPTEGDFKFTYHFAWFPTQVDEGLIWFETYQKVYMYTIRDRVNYIMNRLDLPVYFKGCGGWDLIITKRKLKMGFKI